MIIFINVSIYSFPFIIGLLQFSDNVNSLVREYVISNVEIMIQQNIHYHKSSLVM